MNNLILLILFSKIKSDPLVKLLFDLQNKIRKKIK